jgi:hypothetical protein
MLSSAFKQECNSKKKVQNNTNLTPSPVARERVGERVLAIFHTLFIKTNFIFYDEATCALLMLFPILRALSPTLSRATGEGARPRQLLSIRFNLHLKLVRAHAKI